MALGTTIEGTPLAGEPPKWKWTRESYHRAADFGMFGPEQRTELIRGEIYEKMSPQNWPHASTMKRVAKRLERAFGDTYEVFIQSPMAASVDSEPEPDVMVTAGTVDDFEDHPGPSDSVLVVEVADSSVSFDRRTKASLYAEVGLADYWISSVNERCLYVLRDPGLDADGNTVYRSVVRLLEHEAVSPLMAPDQAIVVADLLPKRRARQKR